MKISVCMATYNGARFVCEQLDSILYQISHNDEIVIVDDCSKDNTVDLIRAYSDTRIRIFCNSENLGVNKTFEKAISLACGEYIFLSDQDDIWCPGRMKTMKDALDISNVLLVSTLFSCIDGDGNTCSTLSPMLHSLDSNRYIRNIFGIFLKKRSYYGCAMAFRYELKKIILPFPFYIESHDLWIAFAANICCSNLHLEYCSLLHKVHGENASIVKRNIIRKINSRIIFLISIIHLYLRKYMWKFITRNK